MGTSISVIGLGAWVRKSGPGAGLEHERALDVGGKVRQRERVTAGDVALQTRRGRQRAAFGAAGG